MPHKHKRRAKIEALLGKFYRRKLAARLSDHSLWHLTRSSLLKGVFVGLFSAMIPPLPIHAISAVLLSIYLRANIPVAVSIIWLSNPLTYVPIIYATYNVGAWMLSKPYIGLNLLSGWNTWLEQGISAGNWALPKTPQIFDWGVMITGWMTTWLLLPIIGTALVAAVVYLINWPNDDAHKPLE